MSELEYKKEIPAKIISIVENEYGIKIHSAEQLFLGADKDTFAYKINTKKNSEYFLKIRTGEFSEAAIVIPYLLSGEIGRHIIAPVKTADNKLFLKTPDYTVILYPFINGKSGRETDLSEAQWIEFGKTMRKIHDFKLPKKDKDYFHNKLNIPREKFDSSWIEELKTIMNGLRRIHTEDQYVKQFIDMLENRRTVINELMLRAEELLHKTDKTKIRYRLRHAEIHAANLLVTEDDFYIVDWDTVIMAPKERDLMFIGGGVAGKWNTAKESDLFYKGYFVFYGNGKRGEINRTILDYYRYIRIIEDMVVYYGQFFAENVSEKNRASITERVDSSFWPGGVVEMAIAE